MVKVRPAAKNDIAIIADIHYSQIDRGILYSLGKKFLNLIYLHILSNKDSVIYVSENNGKILGFISGTVYKSEMTKLFYTSNLLKCVPIISISVLRSPSLLIKLFQSIFFTHSLEEAELLSIAVIEKRKGYGKLLLDALIHWYKLHDIDSFCVEVDDNSPQANAFYKKYGFNYTDSFKIGNIKYNRYIYLISK